MKVILYVFSGTGNTLAVANLYKKFLENNPVNEQEKKLIKNTEEQISANETGSGEFNAGTKVDIYRVSAKSGKLPMPDGYDVVGVGYPIHAFCAPEPIIKLCKRLPALKNGERKRAFIFKSSGEGLHVNDCSSQKCIKILTKKGYDVQMERHFVMPYNMIYRHRDEMAKHMWIYTHALVDLSCRELIAGKREKVKKPFIETMWFAPIGWIEQKFAHVHGTAFRVDSKKCVNCGLCASICPENNITLENGIYKFGHKCVLCMGCAFNCPKDAVKVGVFKFWKVNGSYRLNELAKKEELPFPYVQNHAKVIYKLYKKYYKESDRRLKEAGIDVNDYISN